MAEDTREKTGHDPSMPEGRTREHAVSSSPTPARPIRRPWQRRSAFWRNPFAWLTHQINRLPIPRLRTLPALIGIVGMFLGCIAISVVAGITLRATLNSTPLADNYGLPTATPNATPNPTFQAPNVVGWQGSDRVTVLVMGVDTRPEERGYRTRTDTMMILSVNPTAKTASMLSIPRDLYVDIPGYGLERINTAYPLGGSELAVETVQYNLGIRIDYYAIVEFNAFVTLVDEIGGIDIYVPVTIEDPIYPSMDYGFDPLYIPAGQQHMDGITALKYARTRHQDNDYERARRQQAVILAIRDKVLNLNMLPQLIQRAPVLATIVGESFRSNLTVQQIIDLALLAQDVPSENIRQGVIDSQYIMGYQTPQGAQVSIPNRIAIGPLLEHVFWLDQ